MTTTLHDAITEAIISNDYEAPDSLRRCVKFIDGLVRRHPHLERYKAQVARLVTERFITAAMDAKAEVEVLLDYLSSSSIEGIEPVIEVVGFRCPSCHARAEVPRVIFERRAVPFCDACRRRELLERPGTDEGPVA